MKLWRERNKKKDEEKWKVVLECNKIIENNMIIF